MWREAVIWCANEIRGWKTEVWGRSPRSRYWFIRCKPLSIHLIVPVPDFVAIWLLLLDFLVTWLLYCDSLNWLILYSVIKRSFTPPSAVRKRWEWKSIYQAGDQFKKLKGTELWNEKINFLMRKKDVFSNKRQGRIVSLLEKSWSLG